MSIPKKVVPMIHVPDVRATVEWYKTIGFDVVVTYADETGEGFSFAMVSFGATEVMFNQDGETSSKRRREVDLYVYTDNVDDLFERFKDRVEIVEGPHDTFYGMREVIIRDLNRFWITFGQETIFSLLMGGITNGKPEDVRKAVESGKLSWEILNVALAFASTKENAQIVELLKSAGAVPLPEVDLETLQSYVGRYKSEHGPDVEITIDDGRLFAAPAGQQPMSLWPLDQTTFKPIAIEGATIIFNVEDGQTVGVTLKHDGFKMHSERVE